MNPAENHPLSSFINEVANYSPEEIEKNLFSLGAKRHFENPTSDLLAFFLNPMEEHGLGTTFLDSLFECSTHDSPPPRTFVSIRREVKTDDGKFIDIEVRGESWLLLIENKIHSGQNNPFSSYEAYAVSNSPRHELIYFILSPGGASESAGWEGISYRRLCEQVKIRLSSEMWKQPVSKWQIFAREFITHLETLLYRQNMKSEDFQFVLNHLSEFRKTKRLADDFLEELQEHLKASMLEIVGVESVSTSQHYGWGTPENWAIRCRSDRWGQSNIAFYPRSDSDNDGFQLTVYCFSLTSEQLAFAKLKLGDKFPVDYSEENGGKWSCWRTRDPLSELKVAVDRLKEFTAIVHEVLIFEENSDAI